MISATTDYNLALTFIEQGSGTYLAGVKVNIRDINGNTVLDTVSNSPVLKVKLPPEKYSVQVEIGGKVLHQAVDFHSEQGVELVFFTGRRTPLVSDSTRG